MRAKNLTWSHMRKPIRVNDLQARNGTRVFHLQAEAFLNALTHRVLHTYCYRKNGNFSQIRVFGDDRIPVYDIDYGKHQGKYSLHVYYFKDGERGKGSEVTILHEGDSLFEKYKRIFKGVKL